MFLQRFVSYLILGEISTLRSLQVGEAEGQLLSSTKQRFVKPTNHCRKLKIFTRGVSLEYKGLTPFGVILKCDWGEKTEEGEVTERRTAADWTNLPPWKEKWIKWKFHPLAKPSYSFCRQNSNCINSIPFPYLQMLMRKHLISKPAQIWNKIIEDDIFVKQLLYTKQRKKRQI